MSGEMIVVRKIFSLKHLATPYFVLLNGESRGVLHAEIENEELALSISPGKYRLAIESRFLGLHFPLSSEVNVEVSEGEKVVFTATPFAKGWVMVKRIFFPSLWLQPAVVLSRVEK